MILPHQRLAQLAQEHNLDWPHIGPASVDLRLHETVIVKRYWIRDTPRTASAHTFKRGFFYLASSIEEVYCPPEYAAFVQMRSSLARRGLGHKMAGFVDPGFRGQITFELETTIPVTVRAGERIAQIVYIALTEPTDKPYTGKYLGQQGPTEAYK